MWFLNWMYHWYNSRKAVKVKYTWTICSLASLEQVGKAEILTDGLVRITVDGTYRGIYSTFWEWNETTRFQYYRGMVI